MEEDKRTLASGGKEPSPDHGSPLARSPGLSAIGEVIVALVPILMAVMTYVTFTILVAPSPCPCKGGEGGD